MSQRWVGGLLWMLLWGAVLFEVGHRRLVQHVLFVGGTRMVGVQGHWLWLDGP